MVYYELITSIYEYILDILSYNHKEETNKMYIELV